MLVDLTYKCSMGCSHCMSDCKPDGEHMSVQTLIDVLDFAKRNNIVNIVYSGGEMFENPNILKMLDLIADDCIARNIPMSLTTNGKYLANSIEAREKLNKIKTRMKNKNQLVIQVTDDDRFYPSKLSQKEIYNLKKLGAVVEPVPSPNIHNLKACLYPQGRALDFDESWYYTKAPKCTNCRIFVKQIENITFNLLNKKLLEHQKFCTPAIDPQGNIKVGESRLCPAVSSIYKKESEIIEDIRNFKCTNCTYSLNKLKETNEILYQLFII